MFLSKSWECCWAGNYEFHCAMNISVPVQSRSRCAVHTSTDSTRKPAPYRYGYIHSTMKFIITCPTTLPRLREKHPLPSPPDVVELTQCWGVGEEKYWRHSQPSPGPSMPSVLRRALSVEEVFFISLSLSPYLLPSFSFISDKCLLVYHIKNEVCRASRRAASSEGNVNV